MISEAQKKAVAKYNGSHYDRLELKVEKPANGEKGLKDRIKEHAAECKESVNAFIIRAVLEALEREE